MQEKVIDISQAVNSEIAHWPGDTPFRRRWTARIEEGSPVTIGALSCSTHTGTHADAPLHVREGAAPIDQLPLDAYVGPARVVAVEDGAEGIRPDHVADLNLHETPRVLFKTRASQHSPSQWQDDFPPVLPETIAALSQQDVVLIGTDAPSVDPADSQDLPAHHALFRQGMVNLENLALGDVEPGPYRLIALPLRLEGLDASPVRAVLVE